MNAKRKQNREHYEKGHPGAKHKGRYSGQNYENPPERIAEIKEKYKNGITLQMLEEMFL